MGAPFDVIIPKLVAPKEPRILPRTSSAVMSSSGKARSRRLRDAARAKAQNLVEENNAQAAALRYRADAMRADLKKHPKFAANQNGTNCALYQGKAPNQAVSCPLFAGKQAAGVGWCSGWVKKA